MREEQISLREVRRPTGRRLPVARSHSTASFGISLNRFSFNRQTGARRKVMTPVRLAEQLHIPLASRQAIRYRLYAVIVHTGHSLDTGHYYSFCRSSDAGRGPDGADGGWWRLDDSSTAAVTAEAGDGRQPELTALPSPLQDAVVRDNAEYRRRRENRPI